VHKIDRLKRSNEHTELNDFSIVIASDHVNAIDVLAFNCGFKLEYGVIAINNIFGVAEALR
jgi:hypothetical protein